MAVDELTFTEEEIGIRAGFNMCGVRLEALLRSPTQWSVKKFLRVASSHNDRNR